jgi:hypothetical protein
LRSEQLVIQSTNNGRLATQALVIIAAELVHFPVVVHNLAIHPR